LAIAWFLPQLQRQRWFRRRKVSQALAKGTDGGNLRCIHSRSGMCRLLQPKELQMKQIELLP
jgi:hypothetical protein